MRLEGKMHQIPHGELEMRPWCSAIFMARLFIRWLFSSFWKPVDEVPQQGADDLLNMCRGILSKYSVQLLSENSRLMNKHQCVLLVKKLSEIKEPLALIQMWSVSGDKTTPVLHELHQALVDADRLIQSSCITTSEWLRAVIEHGDMKETFSRVLYEAQWHTEVLQSILGDELGVSGTSFELARCDGQLIRRDVFALQVAMKQDEKELKDRLRSVKVEDPTERELANQLLQKLKAVEDQVSSTTEYRHQLIDNREAPVVGETSNTVGSVTSSFNLLSLNPQNPNDYYCGVLLGRGASGSVRVTNLLGGEYAIKIFEQNHSHSFDQEMAALEQLGHHPHIVRLFFYSKANSDCFLIMEKMDMELSEYLKRRVASDDCRLLEAVVLMLRIAEGVRYIHSKRMAHRDLKPGNVLVTVEDRSSQSLSRARSVKIADFGLTKTRNASKTYADQTVNTGTSKYMAPEVIKAAGDANRAVLNPRKADSYSFAVMCSEILTREDPFGELGQRPSELKKEVKADRRPKLPEDCPLLLKSLIKSCWAGNFHSRPLFPEICQELRYIKGLLLRGEFLTSSIIFPSIGITVLITFCCPCQKVSSSLITWPCVSQAISRSWRRNSDPTPWRYANSLVYSFTLLLIMMLRDDEIMSLALQILMLRDDEIMPLALQITEFQQELHLCLPMEI
jgi:serine/threonine protein kinase